MRVLLALLIAFASGCGAKMKKLPGMYDRDDPDEGPGDALVGPFGSTDSPGLNTPPKQPPPRR